LPSFGSDARFSSPVMLASVDPEQVVDLGPLAREAGSLAEEFVLVDRAGDDLARDAHELLLVLDQAQADLLLRDLGVALDRLLLAFEFLVAQVPERRNDGREKEQDGDQWTECREAILLRQRLAPPPTPEQPARHFLRAGSCRRERGQAFHLSDYRGHAASRLAHAAKRLASAE